MSYVSNSSSEAEETNVYEKAYDPDRLGFLPELLQYHLAHPEAFEDAAETGVFELDLTELKNTGMGVCYDELRNDPSSSFPHWPTITARGGEQVFTDGVDFLESRGLVPDDVEAPDDYPGSDVDVEWVNIPDEMRIRIGEANTDQYGKMVVIEGLVVQASEQRPRLVEAQFICKMCGERSPPINAEGVFDIDNVEGGSVCDACGKKALELDFGESVFHDYQQIKLQEPTETALNPEDPTTTKIELVGGDLVGTVKAGERVTVRGFIRHFPEKNSTVLDTYIDATNLSSDDQTFEAIELTESDIEKIIEFGTRDDALDVFASNIAPQIVGHDEKKRAIALQLVGGTTYEHGESREGGEINILFMGSPSTGKTDLLEAAHGLATMSNFTSGTGASGVGLTATADREEIAGESRWVAKAGPVVLSDRGHICIDEFDKIRDDDKSSLNDALEKGEVHLNKASINTTLKARVSALVAANPIDGNFDLYDDNLIEQFNLSSDLMSRFDLNFPFFDRTDREIDEEIARNVLLNRTTEGVRADEPLDKDFMRKYVAYARQNIEPERTDEASELLVGFWTKYRDELSNDQTGQTAIDTRALNTLSKLADASARFRLSEETEVSDARVACQMVARMLDQMHRNASGDLDVNTFLEGWREEMRQQASDEDDDEQSGVGE